MFNNILYKKAFVNHFFTIICGILVKKIGPIKALFSLWCVNLSYYAPAISEALTDVTSAIASKVVSSTA